jgi:hypothetical protein
MPTPTIPAGNLFMNATLYTGNGTSLTVTNGAAGQSFQPDMVWVKDINTARNHVIGDSVRGVNLGVFPNLTSQEINSGYVSAFNSNGFSLGTDVSVNASTETYVGWQWKAGGTAVTNTSGTISSQVSANTTSGFSVVTYTGNGSSSATVGHGLGVAPAMVILKSISLTSNWWVNHSGIPNSWCQLDTTGAAGTGGGTNGAIGYQSTNTSTVFGFTAGSSSVNSVNTNGATYVAYCWSEIAGFSKFGSYTGNGSTDGPFIYTGFRPKFIMIKNSIASGNGWIIIDTARDIYNQTTLNLFPNSSGAETNSTTYSSDILSNGFKIRATDPAINGSSNTLIYMAFAENPFKYANAR